MTADCKHSLAGHKAACRLQVPFLPVPATGLHSALQQQEESAYAALIEWSHRRGMVWPHM
jgi:hypothetical protein